MKYKSFVVMFAGCIMLTGCGTSKPAEMPAETIGFVVNTNQYATEAREDETDSSNTAAEYRKMAVDEAYQFMEENQDYILLDVGTEAEFKAKRIPGSISIPDNELADRAEVVLPNKETVILLYCRDENRSAAAAKELVDMGYANVYDFGTIEDWTYETVSE